MGSLTSKSLNNLYSIIEQYTSDGSKISLKDLCALSGLAETSIINSSTQLSSMFPHLRRTTGKECMFWISFDDEENKTVYKRPPRKITINRITNFIKEANGKKVSTTDISNALNISKQTVRNNSSEVLYNEKNIMTSGGKGGQELVYWLDKKETDMPKEKPVENIMTTSPILDDDQICTPGEIWTEKGKADAHGYDKRKWLVVAAVGHTVQALEVRTSEKGYNGMRDIWIDKAGICYLAPRLLRQMSDSQLDQYVATAPDDVMDKVRDKLRDIFGIKPVEIEKIVEVPVEVEKIVEKTVEVPVEVEKIVEVEKKENPGDISISKLEFELLKQRARIYESITKSLLARREVG